MVDSGTEELNLETGEVAPGVWRIRLRGSLDWSNFSRVETAIEGLFSKGVYTLIVDLKETKYISSAGFGCFISALDTATKNNGDVVFIGTPPEIQDIFNILGLSKILRFARDERAALAHLQKK